MSEPLVSIVIPVYNGSDFVAVAIESALKQKYGNTEVIVVDDGSDDDGATREAVRPYLDSIQYIEKPNGGTASALNVGLRSMSGEWFSWLSHDDRYRPEKLKTQVDFAERSGAVAIYSDYRFIDSDGHILDRIPPTKAISGRNFAYQLLSSYPVNGCATLTHQSVFEAIGVFDENLPTTHDYDLWFRISTSFDFQYCDAIVVDYRIHEKQSSVTMPWRQRECDNLYSRIARTLCGDGERTGLQKNDVMECVVSLANRSYWSAAYATCGLLKSPIGRKICSIGIVTLRKLVARARTWFGHASKTKKRKESAGNDGYR